jgi:putative transcriptional regulator
MTSTPDHCPRHHPQDDLLIAHASGNQHPSVDLLVSVHEALCAQCRSAGIDLRTIGAAMLEDDSTLPSMSMSSGARERALAAIASPPPAFSAAAGAPASEASANAPGGAARATVDFVLALRDHPEKGDWRWRAPGVKEVRLPLAWNGIPVTVARLHRGLRIPKHTHHGRELTLILSGGFRDAIGEYRAGDVADYDSSVSHKQYVDTDEDCLCLVVNQSRLVPQTLLGRALAWISGA